MRNAQKNGRPIEEVPSYAAYQVAPSSTYFDAEVPQTEHVNLMLDETKDVIQALFSDAKERNQALRDRREFLRIERKLS